MSRLVLGDGFEFDGDLIYYLIFAAVAVISGIVKKIQDARSNEPEPKAPPAERKPPAPARPPEPPRPPRRLERPPPTPAAPHKQRPELPVGLESRPEPRRRQPVQRGRPPQPARPTASQPAQARRTTVREQPAARAARPQRRPAPPRPGQLPEILQQPPRRQQRRRRDESAIEATVLEEEAAIPPIVPAGQKTRTVRQPAKVSRNTVRGALATPADLRTAIVLTEVLGPPVALRPEHLSDRF